MKAEEPKSGSFYFSNRFWNFLHLPESHVSENLQVSRKQKNLYCFIGTDKKILKSSLTPEVLSLCPKVGF